MDFRSMNYICTIAKCQTISKAAEELYISQPSLSLYLKKLESELNLKLFERINKKMYPTYAGKKYIEYAQSILQLNNRLNVEMISLANYKTGRLSIGSTHTRTSYILRDLLPIFQRRYPDFIIEIKEGTHEQLVHMLDSHLIDFAFYTTYELDNQHVYYHLMNEEIVLCASAERNYGQLARKKEGFSYPWIDIRDIQNDVFLMVPEVWRAGQIARKHIQVAKIKPRIMEFEVVQTAVALAGNGLGVSFCSDIMVRRGVFVHTPEYFSIGDTPYTVDFVLAHRNNFVLTPPLQEFINLAMQTLKT